ncbi:MAG TPA: cupin domain-containing protein [Kofleriaceae bacterium]
MRSVLVVAIAVALLLSGIMLATTAADRTDRARREIVGLTPQQVKWFTPPYYKDGRERAQLVGDSSKGGAWVDRVKIPSGKRVLAHTHPDDEMVTVIEGTWYLGAGERFDATRLQAYPAGSFVVIPAGLPHFVATKDVPAIVQSSGNGVFRTDFLEK